MIQQLAFEALTAMAFRLNRASGRVVHLWVSLWRPERVQHLKCAVWEGLVF